MTVELFKMKALQMFGIIIHDSSQICIHFFFNNNLILFCHIFNLLSQLVNLPLKCFVCTMKIG